MPVVGLTQTGEKPVLCCSRQFAQFADKEITARTE